MNRRFVFALLLAVAGTSFLAFAPVADAVDAPSSGWWARLATATPTDEAPAALPVPVPAAPDTIPAGATVPPGQLLVEGAPDGATAITAVRWELADGESSPSLTLPVASGSTLNPESLVLACRTATPWEPPGDGPGSWDVKPLVDGSRCVNGIIADDLSNVTFGVQPLMSGNTLDLVLVPGEQTLVERPPGVPELPADTDGSVFRWLLDPPSVESLDVVAGSDFSEGEGDRFVTPPAGNTPDLGPVESPQTPAFQSAAPDTGPPLDAAAPALEPQDLAPSVPDLTRALPASTTPEPVNRTLGFVLLALAGLVAAWAYLTSNGIGPGAAAADGDVVVGGLSRFARPRTTPPTRLS